MEVLYFLVKNSNGWYQANNWDMAHSLWYMSNNGFVFGLGISLLIGLIFAVIYYLILGRFTSSFSHLSHWFVFLAITGITSFFSAFFYAKNSIIAYAEHNDYFEDAPEMQAILQSGTQDMWMYATHNLIYAILFYFLFSLLFKRFSLHCSMTPFGKANTRKK
jgi:hypothetical protein